MDSEDQTLQAARRSPSIRDRSRSPSIVEDAYELPKPRKSIDSQSSAHDSIHGRVKTTVGEVPRDSGIADAIKELRQELVSVKAEQRNTATAANSLIIDLKKALSTLTTTAKDHDLKLAQQLTRDQRQQQKLEQVRVKQQQYETATENLAHDSSIAFQTLETVLEHQNQRMGHQEQTLEAAHQGNTTNTEPTLDAWMADPIGENPPECHGNMGGSSSDYRQNAPTQPTVRGGSLAMPVISANKITPPPAFDSAKYLNWQREYQFWRDIYWFVGDNQLLSVTGLHANSSLGKFLIQFFRQTRDELEKRTIEEFLARMMKIFSATVRERETYYVGELLSMKREPSESIQNFWFKYDEMMHNLHGSQVRMPDSLMFPRLLKSLNVSHNIRMSVITRLDCQGLSHSIANLRLVTIELMGVYKEMIGKGENVHGSFVTADNTVTDDEQFLMEKALAVARAKKKGRRPSMETTAVRKAVALNNFPNQTYGVDGAAGKGLRCFRCGSPDHMLKNCPHPYTPKLAFAPAGKPAGNGVKSKKCALC